MISDYERNYGGLAAIENEIYAPCGRSSEQPCRACVQIGLRKAFMFGLSEGTKTADEKVRALISLKSCSEQGEGFLTDHANY